MRNRFFNAYILVDLLEGFFKHLRELYSSGLWFPKQLGDGADLQCAFFLEKLAGLSREAVGRHEGLRVRLHTESDEHREELATIADQHAVRDEVRERELQTVLDWDGRDVLAAGSDYELLDSTFEFGYNLFN